MFVQNYYSNGLGTCTFDNEDVSEDICKQESIVLGTTNLPPVPQGIAFAFLFESNFLGVSGSWQ